MANVEILELVDVFSGLDQEQLEKIYEQCKEVRYFQGELIFAENSPSTEFYIIIEGEVEILVSPDTISSGKKHHEPVAIAHLRQGQSFGEIALVDQGVRSASAVCCTMVATVLVINREDFMRLMRQDTLIGFQVMSNLAADLCTKIRQTNLNLRHAVLYSPKDALD